MNFVQPLFLRTQEEKRGQWRCEDADFCSIEVNRKPQMDKYYTDGKREMDWEDSQDRIALVKDCGFSCSDDCFDIDYCEDCPAKEYCDEYIDRKG